MEKQQNNLSKKQSFVQWMLKQSLNKLKKIMNTQKNKLTILQQAMIQKRIDDIMLFMKYETKQRNTHKSLDLKVDETDFEDISESTVQIQYDERDHFAPSHINQGTDISEQTIDNAATISLVKKSTDNVTRSNNKLSSRFGDDISARKRVSEMKAPEIISPYTDN